MPLPSELLEVLVCPETHQPVTPADAALLEDVNRKIRSGSLRTRGGEPVRQEIREALVREDRRVLYRVEDDIPVMLIEESIELA